MPKSDETVTTNNLIIGAGPAGLAMAGYFERFGTPYMILEASDQVAHSWHNHYDRLHLHTTKGFSHLPFMSFPAEYPKYIPRTQVVEYFELYAKRFGIRPRFNSRVTSIKREEGLWVTTTEDGLTVQSSNVIVATGLNRVPNWPQWDGFDDYQGAVMHSREYRNGRAFAGQKVLVVGLGNTGGEIAIDLHESGAAQVDLCVRGRVNIVYRDVLGRPTTDTSLLLDKSGLPYPVIDAIAGTFQKITVGDLSPYGLPSPDLPPSRQQREFGTTPLIDVGTVDLVKEGHIRVKPGIRAFTTEGVGFLDGSVEPYDQIVLATGYRPQLPDFITGVEPLLDTKGFPKAMWHERVPGLYLLGFDSCVSGQLYCINRDAGVIFHEITNHEYESAMPQRPWLKWVAIGTAVVAAAWFLGRKLRR